MQYAFIFAVALVLLAQPARAMDEQAAATPPDPSAAGTPQDLRHREFLTGDWHGRRTTLSDRGIAPYATWTSQVTSNVSGGLRTATDTDGVVEFGVDLDLEKLGVSKSATVHISGFWIEGDDPSADYVGNFDEVNNLAALQTVRFYQAYLKKDFRGGKVSAKIGQIALDDDFMVSSQSQLFVNASFGPLPIESANTLAPIYPLGALGVWAQVNASKNSWVQAGIYDGDAGTQAENRHGFDASLSSDQGAMILVEAGTNGTVGGVPGTYKVGVFIHTGQFTDYASGQQRSGNYAMYVVLDQALVGARDNPTLGGFLRGGLAPQDARNEVHWYVDAGLTGRGLRDGDRAGIGLSHSHFGDAFVTAQLDAGTPVRGSESVIELTYLAQVTPWLALQPGLQYVIDPQNAAARNAWVVTLRFKVSL